MQAPVDGTQLSLKLYSKFLTNVNGPGIAEAVARIEVGWNEKVMRFKNNKAVIIFDGKYFPEH